MVQILEKLLAKATKKFEKYPVIISHLKFRENGDVDFDPNSRLPKFVDYNNTRLLIKKAKDEGKKFAATCLSGVGWDEIIRDGYKIRLDYTAEHKKRHIITW